ncbi:lysozyme inhibitor LprI family protein [Bosea sp. BH3]|uniref:lysozyme inhibitor LprI family protein n=1 Tax=Bosea sp. BH3 TaxID=2871701 RepID=UPI0021CB08E9|nr:lysozyme inhibitor LprI family protein [Bosea sp. BH3]MCU4182363.1 lysozyme inhibitor LprI family protein [Bosea sp. BH3]
MRAASSDPRGAEAGCARREEAAWRERLTLALQVAGRTLDTSQRSRLAAVQLAWESYVAQKCAFYGSVQREGLQAGRQAGCELREVAGRAIEVTRALPQPERRRPQSPPQIIR